MSNCRVLGHIAKEEDLVRPTTYHRPTFADHRLIPKTVKFRDVISRIVLPKEMNFYQKIVFEMLMKWN